MSIEWWLAIAGFCLFAVCAIAQARAKIGRAIAHRLLAYGMLAGFWMMAIGLIWVAHQHFKDTPWYQTFLFSLAIVVLIGFVLALIGMALTLLRSKNLVGTEPLETHSRFAYVDPVAPHASDAPPSAPRNYVICIDGTWNDPDSHTNVHRFWNYLVQESEQQIAKYYKGVGVKENTKAARRIFGAATRKMLLGCGTGLGARIIRSEAYVEFVRLVRSQDRVYIFGFSRGAAIARMLANDILYCGIPRLVSAKYQKSRDKDHSDYLIDIAVLGPKQNGSVPIAMLGLWDTVTAFGLPWLKLDPLAKLTIDPAVEKAFHLVAIDERRLAFDATLANHDGGNVEEIWFAGAHSNVGGGFGGHNRLSDITLRFIMHRAKDAGLQFTQEGKQFLDNTPPAEAEADGDVTDIWTPERWWILRTTRKIQVKGGGPGIVPRIHKSVFDRKTKPACEYTPPSLNNLEPDRDYKVESRV
jgi:T6SS, Phospholipase effector Tle1-like, catalytic domain